MSEMFIFDPPYFVKERDSDNFRLLDVKPDGMVCGFVERNVLPTMFEYIGEYWEDEEGIHVRLFYKDLPSEDHLLYRKPIIKQSEEQTCTKK